MKPRGVSSLQDISRGIENNKLSPPYVAFKEAFDDASIRFTQPHCSSSRIAFARSGGDRLVFDWCVSNRDVEMSQDILVSPKAAFARLTLAVASWQWSRSECSGIVTMIYPVSVSALGVLAYLVKKVAPEWLPPRTCDREGLPLAQLREGSDTNFHGCARGVRANRVREIVSLLSRIAARQYATF